MFDNQSYKKRVQLLSPPSPLGKDLLFAFLIGGTICLAGQGLTFLFLFLGAGGEDAATLTSVTLIFLSVVLTALGLYDDIARVGGAGTLVPVSGFANAVVSPAIDAGKEGALLGVGAKIFTVAGPVILFGVLSGAVYGVIFFLSLTFL